MERFLIRGERWVPVVLTTPGCLSVSGWLAVGAAAAFQQGDAGYGVFFAAAAVLIPGWGTGMIWYVQRLVDRECGPTFASRAGRPPR